MSTHIHKTAAFRSALGTDTTGNLSFRQQVHAQRDLLKNALPGMHTHLFGGNNSHAQNMGLTIRARRYLPIALDLTPLVEGENPTPAVLTYTDVQVVLRQFGRYVEHTDRLIITHEDRLQPVIVSLLSRNYAETMEVLNLIELTQGTSVRRAGGVAARNLIQTALSAEDLQVADRMLSRASAEPIASIVGPSAKTSTVPVPDAFYALCSTDLKPDLMALPGWIPYEKYANGGNRFVKDEMGAWGNLRFIGSQYCKPDSLHLSGTDERLWTGAGAANAGFLSNGAPGTAAVAGGPENVPPAVPASNCDVYPILVFAKDAYVCQKLQGFNAVKIMIRAIDTPDSSDALGLKGTAGWKSFQGCMITHQDYMVRIEVACSNSREMIPTYRVLSD